MPREVLWRGADGNLGLGDFEAHLGPLRHRLEADASLDQSLGGRVGGRGGEKQKRMVGLNAFHLAYVHLARSARLDKAAAAAAAVQG